MQNSTICPACPSPPAPFLFLWCAADIEMAFYNASGAKSPLAAVAKGLRGLIPGQKKQQ